MELPGRVGAGGHGFKELLPRVLGVTGHEADKIVPWDFVNLLQEIREIHGLVQVLAVGVDVLAQEGDLLVPRLRQGPDLGKDILHLPAPFPPPDIGHDTVGAEVVAPVHNGNPCLDAALPHHRQSLGDGAPLIGNGEYPLFRPPGFVQQLRKLPQGLRAEYQVHMAVGMLDLIRHRRLLGHAAADAEQEVRVFLLGVDQLAHRAEHLFFRVLPDGAGIEDDDVRLIGVLGKGAAHVPQHPHDTLAVRHVLLAPVGLHAGQGRPLRPALAERPDLPAEPELALDVLFADPLGCYVLVHDFRSFFGRSPGGSAAYGKNIISVYVPSVNFVFSGPSKQQAKSPDSRKENPDFFGKL